MYESPVKYLWMFTVEFSWNFKLHNVQLTQVSHREQCHSKGRAHSFFKKAETGQGHGTLQGRVTQTGMSSNFWSLLPLLCSLQFVIWYLRLGRQGLRQLYLSFPLSVISVSCNECKRDRPSLQSPQQIEVIKSRHPSPLLSYLAISLKESPSLPCCLTFDSYHMQISNSVHPVNEPYPGHYHISQSIMGE